MAELNDSLIIVKYFCHNCNKSVDTLISDQKCSHCRTGFIEEMSESNGADVRPIVREVPEQRPSPEVAEKSECSICLQNMESSEPIKTLICGHNYHKNCVQNWIQETNNCPLCRREVDVSSVVTPQRGQAMVTRRVIISIRNIFARPLQRSTRDSDSSDESDGSPQNQ